MSVHLCVRMCAELCICVRACKHVCVCVCQCVSVAVYVRVCSPAVLRETRVRSAPPIPRTHSQACSASSAVATALGLQACRRVGVSDTCVRVGV